MLAISKNKWLGTIFLAGVLLVLAVVGGKWGTNYTANASVNVAPIIDYIDPSRVPEGSPNTILLINGANFGGLTDTYVRLTGIGVDVLLAPVAISPTAINVLIPAYLLAAPNLYTITVIKVSGGTVPIEEPSNPVDFTVYEVLEYFFPIIYRQ